MRGEVDSLGASEKAVVPLFMEESRRRRPTLVGSACAVTIGSQTFLFTAAHVVEPLPPGGLHTFGAGKILPLLGEVLSSTWAERSGRRDTPFDLAAIRLSNPAILTNIIGVEDTRVGVELAGDTLLTFVGWPSSRAKALIHERLVDARLIRFTLPSIQADGFQSIKLIPRLHIAARFNRKCLVDPSGGALPALYGISGGGIFRTRGKGQHSGVAGSLVGIIVGFADRERVIYGMGLSYFYAVLVAEGWVEEKSLPEVVRSNEEFQTLALVKRGKKGAADF